MCEPQGIVQEGQVSLKGKQSVLCLYLYLLSYIILFVSYMFYICYNIMQTILFYNILDTSLH